MQKTEDQRISRKMPNRGKDIRRAGEYPVTACALPVFNSGCGLPSLLVLPNIHIVTQLMRVSRKTISKYKKMRQASFYISINGYPTRQEQITPISIAPKPYTIIWAGFV